MTSRRWWRWWEIMGERDVITVLTRKQATVKWWQPPDFFFFFFFSQLYFPNPAQPDRVIESMHFVQLALKLQVNAYTHSNQARKSHFPVLLVGEYRTRRGTSHQRVQRHVQWSPRGPFICLTTVIVWLRRKKWQGPCVQGVGSDGGGSGGGEGFWIFSKGQELELGKEHTRFWTQFIAKEAILIGKGVAWV